jgi:hypothetical protein
MLDLVRNATRWSMICSAVQGYYLGRPSERFVDAGALARVEERRTPGPELEPTTAVPCYTRRTSPVGNTKPEARRETEYLQTGM